MGRPMMIAFVSMSCRCERRVRTRQGVPCPRSRFARARGRPRVSPARASRARDSDEAEFVKYVRALRRPKRARGERDRAVRREDVVRDARAMPRLPSRARGARRGDDARRRERRESGRQGAKEYSSRRDGDAGGGRVVRGERDARETRGRTRGGRRVWIVQRGRAAKTRDEDAMKTVMRRENRRLTVCVRDAFVRVRIGSGIERCGAGLVSDAGARAGGRAQGEGILRVVVRKRRRRGGWTRRPRRERRARDARANPWRTEGLDSPKRARGEDAR